MTKRSLLLVAALMAVVLTAAPALTFAGAPAPQGKGKKAGKVYMCHLTDTGDYNLIHVNGNAERAHLRHGDFKPGLDLTCTSGSCADVLFDSASGTRTFNPTLFPPYIIDLEWVTSGWVGDVTYVIYGVTGVGEPGSSEEELDRFTGSVGAGSWTSTTFAASGYSTFRIAVECGGLEVTSILVFTS